MSLVLMTIGNCGMWVVAVVLPAVQKDFGVGRAEASLPYTLMMLGFGLGGILMGRLADRVGLEAVIRRARDLGISTPLEASHSMVLGGSETYLYELARAYAVVANGGRSVPLHGVRRIYDLGVCGSAWALDRCPARGITDLSTVSEAQWEEIGRAVIAVIPQDRVTADPATGEWTSGSAATNSI